MVLWCVWEKSAANSVQYTVCKKSIHKWCSGVRGDVLWVGDSFKCRRCDGTIPEDGCVKSFCYLGDTLVGDGRVVLAATARIRNGWIKF